MKSKIGKFLDNWGSLIESILFACMAAITYIDGEVFFPTMAAIISVWAFVNFIVERGNGEA